MMVIVALQIVAGLLRSPVLWIGVVAGGVAYIAYGVGEGAGYRAGVEVGRKAERVRQAEAALEGSRDAVRDREDARRETDAEWNRAGGDLERLCRDDPACRDRHGLRLDAGTAVVDPGHAGDGRPDPAAQRGARETLPRRGDER